MSTITKDGGTIYIQDNSGTIEYQYNSYSGSWTPISSWPLTLSNTFASSQILYIKFYTNITLNDTSQYFICDSDYLTFEGNNNTTTIDSVTSYNGLIQNGTSGSNGKNNIIIQNIKLNSSSSTLNNLSGWICQSYFCNASLGTITNCSSNGDISDGSGGISGRYTCYNGGNLTISKCYSSGNIASSAGGIIGQDSPYNGGSINISLCYSTGNMSYAGGGIFGRYAGLQNCTINCTKCFSIGSIGDNGGGIFSEGCAQDSTTSASIVNVSNCYSLGSIGIQAGGIFGSYACEIKGTINATNCYSLGNINSQGGGIFGYAAAAGDGSTSGQAITTNCYSIGTIGTDAGGIYGQYYGNVFSLNCYTSGSSSGGVIGGIFSGSSNDNPSGSSNNYSEANNSSSGWKDIHSSIYLTGVPTIYSNNPGSTWGQITNNTPYLLSIFNDSIYSTNSSFITSTEYLTTYMSQGGLFSPGYNYYLLNVNNSMPEDISIDSSSGVLSFINKTPSTYEENVIVGKLLSSYLYNYNFNTFTLFIQYIPNGKICFPAGTPVETDQGLIEIDNINPNINTINNKKVVGISKTILNEKYLIQIEKHSLNFNTPNKTTLISPGHKILYDGKMITAKNLLFILKDSNKIKPIKYNQEILYNVLMEKHDRMIVNNMTVETLDPKNYFAFLNNLNIANSIKIKKEKRKLILRNHVFNQFL